MSRLVTAVRSNAIARIVILVALVFVVTYGGMAVASFIMRTESPIMVVPSTSMVPTLNVGDIVIIKGVDPKTITVGTIIVFQIPGGSINIIHRVVGIVNVGDTLAFVTQGDNRMTNPMPDPWSPVPEKNVKGVLVARIPYIGYVTLALQGPLGIILIAFLIFLMIALEYHSSRKKEAEPARPSN